MTRGALVLLLALAACGQERTTTGANPPPVAADGGTSVTPGQGQLWVVSNEPAPTDPKYYESRAVLEVAGVVTAVEAGPADPRGPQVFYSYSTGLPASQALSLRGDGGIDWKVGYQLQRGKPSVDVTPDLGPLVGRRVRLLVRAVRGFGSAAAVVLSDDRGVIFAMDLAIWGDPFQSGDVPGLTLTDGAIAGRTRNDCFASRHHALIFGGDTPVDVPPGTEATFTLAGAAYTAVNLFNYQVDSDIRCTDIAGAARAWALWGAGAQQVTPP